ncbi:MAG TPA: hypothetical protein DCY25_06005 [Bacteroidales bacterium]|nr:hypothetical protein [Bacteroidales bacterium]
MNKLTRPEFLRKLARSLLIAFLAFLAFSLGSRTVSGKDCSTCPGKRLCAGDNDCSKYSK